MIAWMQSLQVAALALAALAASAALTAMAIAFARRTGMLDLPGRRRSHDAPTPRGGGIGLPIIAAVALWIARPAPPIALALLTSAIGVVALVGWLDDRNGLGVPIRLVVQMAAATAAVVAVAPGAGWSFLALALLGVVGYVNVMNFMDGSNGMATLQGAFIATALMLLAGSGGEAAWSLWSLLLACACLGFLPFNFPRARVFLGDVGSTSLGFALGLAATALVASGAVSLWQVLLAGSVFLVDAGCTLAWRIARGRRWYTAHREHTYQWLIRSGRSHAAVAAAYLAWNLLLVSPLLLLGLQRPQWQPFLALTGFGLAVAAWIFTRLRILGQVRSGAF